MSFSREKMLWLELACLPEFRPTHIHGIASEFLNIEDAFELDHMQLASLCGLPAEAALGISQRSARQQAENEAEWLLDNDAAFITFSEDSYPELLRQIPDPPPVLFYKGKLKPLANCIAVVGSRKCTNYGKQATLAITRELAGAGITIVSGMAWGIDQVAHKSALEAEGQTAAIIGSGLGNIYPKGTGKLVEEICSNGMIATEFTHSIAPSRITFPQRNRIVSGMCAATLVIEAGAKSGALITARLANEQGRDVMAVPGSIFSGQSEGCNWLIQKGAKLVRTASDIIDELPDYFVKSVVSGQLKEREISLLSEEERKIVDLLAVDTPEHIDIIARQLGMETAQLSVTLLELEIKGVVRQLPGMKFIKTL